MAALTISDEIESQIEALARRTGQSRDDLVREAILIYLEDAILAASRLALATKRMSLEEIGRRNSIDR